VTKHGEGEDGTDRELSAPTYEERLATIGLATLLASPALMHGLKGCLHNLGLPTELLHKETTKSDAATLRAAALRRAESLRAEIQSMHRQVQLVEGRSLDDKGQDARVCDVRESLQELMPTTRFEASRRRVRIQLELDPLVERIQCAPRAFQLLVLSLLTHTVRHCGEGATVTVTCERVGGSTRVGFGCDKPTESQAYAVDRRLLGMLAEQLGARVSAAPEMHVTFESPP
jgi:signal transduction histidine kinase